MAMTARRQIVYFHGTPGAAAELGLLNISLRETDNDIFVLNRRLENYQENLSDYFAQLAYEIECEFPEGKIGIIGFSLGTYVALNVAPHILKRIEGLHLISVAAPLHWDDYLDDMAGKAVFKLAKKQAKLFAMLTAIQSLIAQISPGLLGKVLFASAQGADVSLAADNEFKSVVAEILGQNLGRNAQTYKAEIKGYVEDWELSDGLAAAAITLWHGEKDNWSPVKMARDMHRRIGATSRLREFPGLSHYSMLRVALNEIVNKPTKKLE